MTQYDDDFQKALAYDEVETILEIAELEEEQMFLKDKTPDHEDIDYNVKRLQKLRARHLKIQQLRRG
jgi:hypothetical protein